MDDKWTKHQEDDRREASASADQTRFASFIKRRVNLHPAVHRSLIQWQFLNHIHIQSQRGLIYSSKEFHGWSIFILEAHFSGALKALMEYFGMRTTTSFLKHLNLNRKHVIRLSGRHIILHFRPWLSEQKAEVKIPLILNSEIALLITAHTPLSLRRRPG